MIGTRDRVASVAMPHALIVEALTQVSAAVITSVEPSPMIGYFMECDDVRLWGEAKPGDTLDLSVELL